MKRQTLLFKAIVYSFAFAVSLALLEVLFQLLHAPSSDRWIARGAVIAAAVLGGAGQRLIDRNRSSVRPQ
jgi:hypothetical protein